MRGVDVCVRFMPARRTPEDMPLADSQKPAPGAGPACVGRINLGYGQPAQLRLVLDGDADFPPLPEGKATAQGFAANLAFLGLRDATQVLEDKHSIGRSPLHESRGRLLGKGAGAVALLAAKPFERTADASCVLALCLSGREFALEARAGLLGSAVGNLDGPARDEEGIAVGVHRDKGVGFVQVDADRDNAGGLGNLQRHRHAAKEFPIPLDDRKAVDLFGPGQRRAERLRHRVRKTLAPTDGPDRQRAVGAEVGVPPALTDEEECLWLSEGEGAGNPMLVALRALVGGSHSPDRRDSHLTIEAPLDLMVGSPLQRDGAERSAVVVGNRRKIGLNLTEDLQGPPKVRVWFDHNGYGSLNIHHTFNIAHDAGNYNPVRMPGPWSPKAWSCANPTCAPMGLMRAEIQAADIGEKEFKCGGDYRGAAAPPKLTPLSPPPLPVSAIRQKLVPGIRRTRGQP